MSENTTTTPATPRSNTSVVPPEVPKSAGKGSPLNPVVSSVRRVVGGVAEVVDKVKHRARARSAAPVEGTPPGFATQVTLPPQGTSSEAGEQMHKPDEGVLVIPHYDELPAGDAITAVRTLEDLASVQVVARHERSTRARSTVISAIEGRIAELSRIEERA